MSSPVASIVESSDEVDELDSSDVEVSLDVRYEFRTLFSEQPQTEFPPRTNLVGNHSVTSASALSV